MALKELADTAADVSEQVELEQLDADTCRVGDGARASAESESRASSPSTGR